MIKLPEDFVRQTQQYIGQEWHELAQALAQPPTRAARLQKFTADLAEPDLAEPGVAANGSSSRGQTEISSPWYTAGPLAVQPVAVAAEMTENVPWYKTGFYIQPDSQLGKTVLHELGGVYIQEASAMAAVAALNPQPHERILDLCAAPGSKATAIGRRLQGQSLLYANEIVPARAKVLAQNLERSGIPALVTNDNPALLAKVWAGQFDAVLVDAPCSGEGMFRKDPDAAFEWSLDNVGMCSVRQQDILQSAVKLLKPGGRLVYSTCTLNPVENEQVTAWACKHLPLSLEPLPQWAGWETGRPEFTESGVNVEYTRRLWPHRGRGEGHFLALFRLTGSTSRDGEHPSTDSLPHVRKKMKRSNPGTESNILKGQILADWKAWMKTIVVPEPEVFGPPVQYGDGIYVFTETSLPLTEVHVVRNGVCTAHLQNQRFTPHHQFAMALHPQAFLQHKRLDEDEARAYLGGNTLATVNSHGWYGLSFAGLPAGWGKAVPGRVNNLYPKGLRKNNLIVLSDAVLGDAVLGDARPRLHDA
ncbi:RsmF rRNA methyltransferase first C-terminal domain-containing protein [Alicyclobacillus sp. SO9]|uniref:RsmF rRNA methyltransferase first C-terminal domain-containing protein n=1 Tax=Alicyclobacillus sp. SO9 TaxID=2665646 RepID=UPI0018E70800|nr:RsmF rRNA methyltransferase first C-terminal domain-containing protein [Alicyclobacillus sp. SO9]QQE77390.1 RsmF rRNA methyltransferase first C-terminal domain-containing protein [Alicyclobacillus sp. SO9]